MTYPIFPSFRGLDISVIRTPILSTQVQTSVSGLELRTSFWSTPRFSYKLTLNYLLQVNFDQNTHTDEASDLLAFFALMRGRWDCFLFDDPYGNTAVATTIATADGSTPTFTILSPDGFPVGAPATSPAPVFYVDGSPVNGTVAGNKVTLDSTPTNGQVVTWDGEYLQLVRFANDTFDLERILHRCWTVQELDLISVKVY